MKLRSIALAALTVLACALVSTSAAEAATAKKTCAAPKGAKLVRKTSSVLAWTVNRSSGDVTKTLFACYRPNGKRYRLADATEDALGLQTVEFSLVKGNTRFLAWQWKTTDISCKADCPPDYVPTTYAIERVDLKNGKTLTWDDAQAAGVTLASLVVSRRGNVAWTQLADAATNSYVLRIGDKNGSQVIDPGPIGPGLRLSFETLSWTTSAGESKTTTFK